MYKFKIIKSNNLKDSKELLEIKKFINLNNKYWNFNDNFVDFIERLNRLPYSVYFLFLFFNKTVIGGFRYYKIKVNDKILLNRFIYKNGSYYCVQEVFVIEKYRGKKILDKLFAYFENINKKKYKIILAVDKSNTIAIKAYERNNFRKIMKRKVTNKLIKTNTYSEYFVEYLMEK